MREERPPTARETCHPQAGQFLPQVADQAAPPVAVLQHAALRVLDERAQARQRRRGLVVEDPGHLARVVVGVRLDHRFAELVLVGEEVIERALGHAHALEHFVDTGDLEATFGQEFGPAPDQRPFLSPRPRARSLRLRTRMADIAGTGDFSGVRTFAFSSADRPGPRLMRSRLDRSLPEVNGAGCLEGGASSTCRRSTDYGPTSRQRAPPWPPPGKDSDFHRRDDRRHDAGVRAHQAADQEGRDRRSTGSPGQRRVGPGQTGSRTHQEIARNALRRRIQGRALGRRCRQAPAGAADREAPEFFRGSRARVFSVADGRRSQRSADPEDPGPGRQRPPGEAAATSSDPLPDPTRPASMRGGLRPVGGRQLRSPAASPLCCSRHICA